MEKVSLSLPPVSPSGAYQLGKNQGFFEEEGIDLELVVNQGGAAVIPGLVSGNPQFATSNVMSALTATDNNLPLIAIAPGSADHAPPDPGLYGVVTAKGSDIKKTADLEGHDDRRQHVEGSRRIHGVQGHREVRSRSEISEVR